MSLKFFDVVLKFELPNTRVLNFPKISALSLIVVVLINGDCVYDDFDPIANKRCQILPLSRKFEFPALYSKQLGRDLGPFFGNGKKSNYFLRLSHL